MTAEAKPIKPSPELLNIAARSGARISVKINGTEPMEITFSAQSWWDFDNAVPNIKELDRLHRILSNLCHSRDPTVSLLELGHAVHTKVALLAKDKEDAARWRFFTASLGGEETPEFKALEEASGEMPEDAEMKNPSDFVKFVDLARTLVKP